MTYATEGEYVCGAARQHQKHQDTCTGEQGHTGLHTSGLRGCAWGDAVGQAELETYGCGGCGEPHTGPLFFHAACHMLVPPAITYDRERGVLSVDCSVCGQFVADVLVAPDGGPTPRGAAHE